MTGHINVFATQLDIIMSGIRNMLVEKNRKYGNSALEPVRIFSQASPLEQLKVRMDDKLSRLRSSQSDEDEDVINDLIGYLLIYKVAKANAATPKEKSSQLHYRVTIKHKHSGDVVEYDFAETDVWLMSHHGVSIPWDELGPGMELSVGKVVSVEAFYA